MAGRQSRKPQGAFPDRMHRMRWGEKPYYSLDYFLKETYGEKIYKIAIEGGMSCPNRDGTLDTRGCSFCSAGGSGEFAIPQDSVSDFLTGTVTGQLQRGISFLQSQRKYCGNRYIAYFQSYSNTYAPISYLRALYMEALAHPQVAVLSIATRPDCFSPEIYDLLEECNRIKPVWIELGLQTIHESTAWKIRRGYPLSCFEETVHELQKRGIPVITHVILGLPGESREDILETILYLNRQKIQGIKLQLLHILRGTSLAEDYQAGKIQVYTQQEYVDLLLACICHLSPEIVIHRLTGDGSRELLLAPEWSLQKRKVLNNIAHQMKKQHIYQGCALQKYREVSL